MSKGATGRHVLFALMVVASFSTPVRAQENLVFVLRNADSLQFKIINGESVREAIGHVQITQGKVEINCDRATQFVERAVVNLTGSVLIKDEKTTLRAPRGVYHRLERRAEVFDNVQLDDGNVRLTSRYGEYLAEPRIGFFRGNVKIIDTASTVIADSVTYFRNTKQSIAEGRVRIINEADRVIITGGK